MKGYNKNGVWRKKVIVNLDGKDIFSFVIGIKKYNWHEFRNGYSNWHGKKLIEGYKVVEMSEVQTVKEEEISLGEGFEGHIDTIRKSAVSEMVLKITFYRWKTEKKRYELRNVVHRIENIKEG